jgi:hypothetical protein
MTADSRLTDLEKRVRMLTITTLLAIVLAGIATAYAVRTPSRFASGAVTVDERGIHVGDTVGIDPAGVHVRSGKIAIDITDGVLLSGPDGRVEAGVSGKAFLNLSAQPQRDRPIVSMLSLIAAATAVTETFQAGDGAARISVGPATETRIEVQLGQDVARLVPEKEPTPLPRPIPPPQRRRSDVLESPF